MIHRSALLVVILFLGCGPSPPRLQDQGRSVKELQSMLSNSDPTTQARGALGLQFDRNAALDSLPQLIALLESPSALARQNAAQTIGVIGPEAREAMPELRKLLTDVEWPVRRQAAIALGNIGADAKPALPDLEKLERDSMHHVAIAAKEARRKIAMAK